MATNGIQEELEQFDAHIQGCVAASKKALFDGAAVMADAIKAAAGQLPFEPATVGQIQDALGISKFEDTPDGSGTSVSFEGYFGESGFPIPYFVREVEIGSNHLPKIPFVRRARNAAKKAALAAIEQGYQQYIAQETGGADT